MKKSTIFILILFALSLFFFSRQFQYAEVYPVKALKVMQLYKFDIQGIKRIITNPAKIKFLVQYFISPKFPKPCFIGAHIKGTDNWSYIPAGRVPYGVPKGQIHFDNNVSVELNYTGSSPFTSEKIEVYIYTKDKTLKSMDINWGQTWNKDFDKFQIFNVRSTFKSPSKEKFLIRYFITPKYNKPCFIGARIVGTNNWSYIPAGRIPNGVPKGQINFRDNISLELNYTGSAPFTSKKIEFFIYTKENTLRSTRVNWVKTWSKNSNKNKFFPKKLLKAYDPVKLMKAIPQYKFDIQDINMIFITPSKVKFQVRYFISPEFQKACFLGAHIVGTNNWSYIPAGGLPYGVPKGQVHFKNQVIVELNYTGSSPFSSQKIEVFMYTKKKNLKTKFINWGQTWSK